MDNIQTSPMTKEQFSVLWRTIHLKITDEYDVPPEVLHIDESSIGTLGNFSASTGKAKSKKTFNVSAIVAASLCNGIVLHYRASFPESKRKVLYVDTEQGKYHCQKVMTRILTLAGLPLNAECENLIFVAMRELTPEQRCSVIDYMLANVKGVGLVVIDGIRDLMYDINNPTESAQIINLLMRWSSIYNLHIHTVLHMNKGDDNTRGHIGTELNNKAETVLQVTKSTVDADISEVKAMHIRDKDFAPFAFRINEKSLPELIGDYEFVCSKHERTSLMDLPENIHRNVLSRVFNNNEISKYKDLLNSLKNAYASVGYDRGRNTLVRMNKYLMSKGLIVKENKTYQYHPEASF